MSLPTEIIDHILAFLRSDPATLNTCAQSHPILFKLSLRHIYAHVLLHDDLYDLRITEGHRTSEFTQILANTPDIANHVHSLTIFCVAGQPGSKQQQATSSHLNGVAPLLSMLNGLTRLVVAGSWISSGYFAWHAAPQTFRQAFLHYLQPQVMKEVVISNIAMFPIHLLNNCGNVGVTLEFCNEMQYSSGTTPDTEDVKQSYPKHLSILYCSERSVENITAWTKTRRLHSLQYAIPLDSNVHLQPLLVACSNSLTSFRLRTSECKSSRLASLKRLKSTLNFCPCVGKPDTPHRISNNEIPLACTLAGLHHLTQLTLDAQSYLYNSEGSWTVDSAIAILSGLVSTACPTLQKVSINITFSFSSHFEQLPDPVVIWSPFIPLAAHCSSASISLYISPAFRTTELFDDSFSPLADYKALTPYVQRGVVVISEDYLNVY